MYAQIKKTKENKCRTTADSVMQNRNDSKQDEGIVNKRIGFSIQKKMQDKLMNSVDVIKTFYGASNSIQLQTKKNQIIQRMRHLEEEEIEQLNQYEEDIEHFQDVLTYSSSIPPYLPKSFVERMLEIEGHINDVLKNNEIESAFILQYIDQEMGILLKQMDSAKQLAQIAREKEKRDVEPIVDIFSGEVDHDGSKFFISHKGEKLNIINDANLVYNKGTKVQFKLQEHSKVKGLFFAQLVSVGERLPDEGLQHKRQVSLANRKLEVDKIDLKKPFELIGIYGKSGAKKHYGDIDAIAESDYSLIKLIEKELDKRNFEITKIDPLTDEFSIPLGGLMSIVGSFEYTNELKTSVKKIKVWHAGPSI